MIERDLIITDPSEEQHFTALTDEEKIQYILEQPLPGLLLLRPTLVNHPIGSDELREPLVRELLIMVKTCKEYGVPLTILERLRRIGYTWSELDTIEKSLRIELHRRGVRD